MIHSHVAAAIPLAPDRSSQWRAVGGCIGGGSDSSRRLALCSQLRTHDAGLPPAGWPVAA